MTLQKILIVLLIFAIISIYNVESQISAPLFPLPEASQIQGAPSYSSVSSLGPTTSVLRSDSTSDKLVKNYKTNAEIILMSDNDGGQLEITKSIKPNNKDYLLPNKLYQVHVEIRNQGKDSANVQIIEKIEPAVSIFRLDDKNCPYKEDIFNKECIRYINLSNNSDNKEYINFTNEEIFIKLSNLSFNQRFIYDYFILSETIGSYDLNTIIRRGYPTVAELTLNREIEFKNKVYNINAKVEKIYSDVGDFFKISYNIIGDNTDSSQPAIIKFLCNDEYDIFEENKENNEIMRKLFPNSNKKLYQENMSIPVILDRSNFTTKTIYVVYRYPGAYRVPTLLIDGLPYFSDLTIDVDYKINRFAENIYSIVSVLGIIFTLIYTIHEIKPLTREIQKMNELITDISDINYRKKFNPYKRRKLHKKPNK